MNMRLFPLSVALILYSKNFHCHVTSRVNVANNKMMIAFNY